MTIGDVKCMTEGDVRSQCIKESSQESTMGEPLPTSHCLRFADVAVRRWRGALSLQQDSGSRQPKRDQPDRLGTWGKMVGLAFASPEGGRLGYAGTACQVRASASRRVASLAPGVGVPAVLTGSPARRFACAGCEGCLSGPGSYPGAPLRLRRGWGVPLPGPGSLPAHRFAGAGCEGCHPFSCLSRQLHSHSSSLFNLR